MGYLLYHYITNDPFILNKEILTLDDVKQLVDTFYKKVRNDELLSNIFNPVIKDNWEMHLAKMYRFWQTILLNENTYLGNAFIVHANLPIGNDHFTRWLELFNQNIDEQFEGEKAIEAKLRAEKMAELFDWKINYAKTNSTISIV